jgi:hypothetical protein
MSGGEKLLVNPDTGEVLEVEYPYLDENGAEVNDPTPVAPPVGYVKQPSLAEQIREMVRSEKLRQAAEEAGAETFEEADDFEVGDDYDPSTPYENDYDPPISEIVKEVASSKKGATETSDSSTKDPVREDPKPAAKQPSKAHLDDAATSGDD